MTRASLTAGPGSWFLAARWRRWLAPLLALVILLGAAPLAWSLLASAREQAELSLRTEADGLMALVESGGTGVAAANVTQWAARAPGDGRRIVIGAGHVDGVIGTADDRERLFAVPLDRPTRVTLSTGAVRVLRSRMEDQAKWHCKGYEDVTVIIADRAPSPQEIAAAVMILSVLSALALVMVLLGVLRNWYRRHYEQRLIEINAGLVAVGNGHFDPIFLSGPVPDEIGRLRDHCNRMIDRLHDHVQGLEMFLAISAHELRTPMTALRMGIHNLVDGEAAPPGGQVRTLGGHADTILAVFDRVLGMVQTQAGMWDRSGFAPFRLDQLVRACVEDLAPVVEDDGKQLEVTELPAVTVSGDRVLIGRMLINLIDNARKYSLPGARIAVFLAVEQDRFALRITNPGGFPDDIRDIAFQPGRRSALTSDKPGFGLGLFFVRLLVMKHGWSIRLGGTTDMAEVELGGALLSVPGDKIAPAVAS